MIQDDSRDGIVLKILSYDQKIFFPEIIRKNQRQVSQLLIDSSTEEIGFTFILE